MQMVIPLPQNKCHILFISPKFSVLLIIYFLDTDYEINFQKESVMQDFFVFCLLCTSVHFLSFSGQPSQKQSCKL